MVQVGVITVSGMQVGVVTQTDGYTPDTMAYAPSGSDAGDADLGGYTRLGHGRGFYPGAGAQPTEEHHAPRLGHKHGFHPQSHEEKSARSTGGNAATGSDGSGPPSSILGQARDIALHGGPGAVQRFMAQNGYPRDGNWCGEFAASVVHSVGGTPPHGAPIASNWRRWGTAVDTPQPGDIAVRRGTPTGQTGSHVTIVEDFNPKTGRFTGIGGNQGAWERSFPTGQYEFRRGTRPLSQVPVPPASAPAAPATPEGIMSRSMYDAMAGKPMPRGAPKNWGFDQWQDMRRSGNIEDRRENDTSTSGSARRKPDYWKNKKFRGETMQQLFPKDTSDTDNNPLSKALGSDDLKPRDE